MGNGNPPPLSVHPEDLEAAGNGMLASAAELPLAPAPFTPVGSDPLSAAIIAQIPAVDGPPMTELPRVQAQSADTARSVVGAAQAYASTDQQLGGQLGTEMQDVPGAAGTGSGGQAGSAAGSMSQMMSMPMQMMGAVAAVPQGVMQGAQQVGQQVSQMVGQVGQGGMGGSTGSQGGSAGGAANAPGAQSPETQLPEDQQADRQQGREDERDGAAAGRPGDERAPDAREKIETGQTGSGAASPGRHRLPEPPASTDDGIDL